MRHNSKTKKEKGTSKSKIQFEESEADFPQISTKINFTTAFQMMNDRDVCPN
jgi:hypothetical protein